MNQTQTAPLAARDDRRYVTVERLYLGGDHPAGEWIEDKNARRVTPAVARLVSENLRASGYETRIVLGPSVPAVEDILLSLHVGSTAHDVHDAVEKIHALRYPTGCPGGGCEPCVARLAR